MEVSDWHLQMQAIIDTARFVADCPVVDINFDDGTKMEVYLAMTLEQRTRGLSSLATLDLDGMLFYFDQQSYAPFTAEKMLMDIDIAWYNSAGELLDKKFVPVGTSSIYCKYPYSYVLETPVGRIPDANFAGKTDG
jgi:uncharacterized membrane protein (UPF0127 family)